MAPSQELHYSLRLALMAVIAGTFFLSPAQSSAQDANAAGSAAKKTCVGLHAGIHAEIIGPYTETPSVMISFALLNDSKRPIDVESASWRLVVDGSELDASATRQIFGNGPSPIGGYGVLKPGEAYELGKGLPISEFFLSNGDYKVSWKGAAFQSPTITIAIRPSSH